MLLSGVNPGIQVDSQAPEVLVDSEAFSLLAVADSDSTQILQSDGSQAGTTVIADVPGRVLPTDVIGEVNGLLIFRASEPGELWASNGTSAGTSKIADLNFDDAFAESALFNGELFFAADGGDGVELFATDGTTAGTRQVADVNSGENAPAGNTFSFDAIPDAISYDVRLLEYDIIHNAGNYSTRGDIVRGTATGVTGTSVTFSHQSSEDVDDLGQDAYLRLEVTPNFAASQGDPVVVPVQLQHNVDHISSHPSQFTVFQNELWFAAETPGFGREWWKTDGTAAGTELAVDVIPGVASSYPVKPVEFQQQLYFGAFGNQDLYRTDGTTTVKVATGQGVSHLGTVVRGMPLRSQAEILIGSYPIAELNGKLIAQQGGSADSDEHRLVAVDAAGTISDIGASGEDGVAFPLGGTMYFDGFTEVNDRLVFRNMWYSPASSTSLPRGSVMSTDGTTSVTLLNQAAASKTGAAWPDLLDKLGPVQSHQLRFATSFVEGGPGDFVTKASGILTDGTVEGTTEYLVSEANYQTNQAPSRLEVFGDRTFELRFDRFEGRQGLYDLYQIDADGQTFLLDDDGPFASFVAFNEDLYLRRPAASGEELAKIVPREFLAPLTITSGTGHTSDTTPTITWTGGGNGVARYDLYINTVTDRSEAVYRQTQLTSSSHTVSVALAEGTYEVWVRAIYEDGSRTQWGTPEALIIGSRFDGSRPIVTGPGRIAVSQRPLISWTPVTNATSYEVWISGPFNTTPLIHQQGITSTSFSPPTNLPEGTVRVWVRADGPEGKSSWSSAFRFYYPRPAVDFTFEPQQSSRPTFLWGGVDRAVEWDLYLRREGGTGPTYRRMTLTGSSHTVEESLPDGEYKVWLRARFDDGSFSRWQTGGRSLTLQSDDKPALRSVESDRPLTLAVRFVSDELSSFDIRLVDDRGSEPVVLNVDDAIETSSGEWILETDADLPSGDYDVGLRGRLTDGAVTEYGNSTLSIGVPSPGLSVTVAYQTTRLPQINWEASETDVSYDLTVVDEWTGQTVIEQTGLTNTTYQVTSELLYSKYEVRLRAMDHRGEYSDWGTTDLVLRDSDPTFRSQRTSISVEDGVATWNAVPDAERYFLQVNRISGDWIPRMIYDGQFTGTSTDLNSRLEPGRYRVWVHAIHSNGSRSQWSAAEVFEIVVGS